MRTLDAHTLVIGSGPGGAATAAVLAEAGDDVLVVEEGRAWSLQSAPPYSLAEMAQKWRNGGLTPAFGRATVTYVEGRCVGGASEINAALYHPPLPEVLDAWARDYGVEALGGGALDPHVTWVESTVGVSRFPGSAGLASDRLAAGAKSLGWKSREVARFWRYDDDAPGAAAGAGRRMSMSETLLPRAQAAGARLESGLRVRRLELQGRRAVAAIAQGEAGAVRIRFERVVVSAGAVQTALLLRRSGLTRGVGDTLTMNPMIRVVARFDEVVNQPDLGVPVQQIEEFKPQMTLGCSHSSLPHLALWLTCGARERERILEQWPHYGVFYAKISGVARGKVRNVPVTEEAFVRYPMGAPDLQTLGEATHRLGRLLFASGAREILDPLGGPPLRGEGDLDRVRTGMRKPGAAQVSTIHLHSTVPMGSEARGCPADSHGKLRAADNVWVNDASLLPDTPGINPQGTILAVAHRNALRLRGA